MKFVRFDGRDFSPFQDQAFDIVFTKSVVIVVPQLRRILKTGGKFLFLESGRGSFVFQLLCKLRHRHWDFSRGNFFTWHHIALIRHPFGRDVQVKLNWLPPIYLMMGCK